jgi:hypothetical protein
MDSTALALVALNGIVFAVPFWRQWRTRSYDLFHPMVWFSVMNGVPILVKGTSLALGAESFTIALTADPVESLHRALAYSVVGSVCLMAGFWGFGVGGPGIPILLRRSRMYQPGVVVALYAIARVASVLLISEGAHGTDLSQATDQTLVKISMLRPVALCGGYSLFLMLFMAASTRSRSLQAVAGMLLAIDLALASVSGSRFALLVTVLWGVAAVTYARFPIRRLRTVLKWGLIAAAALTTGVLFITQYRVLRRELFAPDQRMSVRESADLMFRSAEVVRDLGGEERTGFLRTSFLERFSAIENLAVTLGRLEELRGLEAEKGMDHNIRKDLLWGFVPRALYPAKPLIGSFGADFSKVYLNDEDITYNGPTVVGDLYRNWGMPGIVLGMAFMGAVLRWLYRRLIVDAAGFPMAALYFLVLSRVNWENTFSPFFTEGVRAIVSLLLMNLLLEATARLSYTAERARLTGERYGAGVQSAPLPLPPQSKS